MGIYSPEEYFRKLYPGWFSETSLSTVMYYVFLFFLSMLTFYIYIQYFEKKKYNIGDEIYCGKFKKDCAIKIVKTMDEEWLAVKINMHTMEKTMLRRGDLSNILDYVNRNFGFKLQNIKKDE